MLRRPLICVFLLTIYCCLLNSITAQAQADSTKKVSNTAQADTTHPHTDSSRTTPDTTHPLSVDPELIALASGKTPPREYTIAGIKVAGTKYLDESLLTSISGLTVGDK